MTADTFQALLPWLVVGGGAVVTLLLTSAARLHGAVAGTAAATLALAALTLGSASGAPAAAALPLLVVDGFTVYFAGLVLLGSIGVVWLAHGYFARHAEQREEFYTALLLATLGAITLVASRHLAALFLGLELLSVGLFVMAAYLREQPMSLEAGLQVPGARQRVVGVPGVRHRAALRRLRHARDPGHRRRPRHARARRVEARDRGPRPGAGGGRLQARAGALPPVGARRLRRIADAVDRLPRVGVEGGHARDRGARVRRAARPTGRERAGGGGHARGGIDARRQPARPVRDADQAAARLLVDRAPRLRDAGAAGVRTGGGRRPPRST